MTRSLIALALLAVPAAAAERRQTLTNFDRVRVDGPYEVQVTTRATPLARVSGDPRALDLVEVRVEGGTLVVRPNTAGWSERPRASGVPAPLIRLQTRDLRSLSVVGGGKLGVTGPVAAPRVDLTVTGAGRLAVPGLAAGEVVATLIGTGAISLGGTAQRARLIGNGAGEIAAAGLTVGDVVVRTEGSTAVTVTARYTATANSTGVGAIEILGKPDCRVRAQAGGPIRCFNAPRP